MLPSKFLHPSNPNPASDNPLIPISMTTTTMGPSSATSMDDDPPPYSAVMAQDHVGWSYDFSRTAHAYPSDSATVPLQNNFARENESPSMPYRLFMCGSGRTVLDFDDDVPDSKDDGARTNRKYGAILVGGAVIIFLMVLSLLVRFVMDKNLWRT
ncbi:uncharacterized protein LOC108632073 [Ceratina calcarata]|uniref:Uncharacterized protein LOC108632073 n=1 Tax=Ceratina calcarata TaxID=156304 RepID=A0AAJ7JFZ1_9HYME|nr:uncharacterized protein LOC108632073 [Ceratina calcarata]